MRSKTGNSEEPTPVGDMANTEERDASYPDRLADSTAQLGLNVVKELQKGEPIEFMDAKHADVKLALRRYTHTNARE